ncbi:aquaporin Z [Planctomycetes bacterium Pan216]|uniref:Aquaporin Z n=1 Tax=Kolteria novifilia TaxID=2527975 RepID=A0A518BAB8_9BACT|nr:aquaporin Z [Planctomycetes bacterium Pan216]
MLFAEAVATFTIVWSSLMLTFAKVDPLAHALGLGGITAAALLASIRRSPGLANPAVTIALAAIGRLGPLRLLLLVGVQVLASIAAAALSYGFFLPEILYRDRFGAPMWGDYAGPFQATLLEMFLGALFMWTLLTASGSEAPSPLPGQVWRRPRLVALVAGAMTAGFWLLGRPVGGCIANPALAIGPAVAGRFWDGQFIYWIGSLLGTIPAAILANVLYRPALSEKGSQDAPSSRTDRSE